MNAARLLILIMLTIRRICSGLGVRTINRVQLKRFAPLSTSASGAAESDDNKDKLVAYRRGDEINAVVTQFGPLGASVTVDGGKGYGLVLQSEIAMYREKNGIDVMIGDSLDAYVERVRDDGKLHVFLRPVALARLDSVAEQVMEALEGSPDASIPVGDKSSPEDIAAYFYGVSKRDFKNAVGALYKEGKARPGPFTTALIGDEEKDAFLSERKAKHASKPSSRFEGDNHDQTKTIFVGNLPFETNEAILTNTVCRILGSDKHASIRLALDDTGRSRGFGYVELRYEEDVDDALEALRGVEVMGRKMRTDYADTKRSKRNKAATRGDTSAGDWVQFLNRGHQTEEGDSTQIRDINGNTSMNSGRRRTGSGKETKRVEASLYFGNLPYSSTTDTIMNFLSTCDNLDIRSVGDIRMGTDEQGRCRGFCHVDFVDEEGAKLVFDVLHDRTLDGRKVRIDQATIRRRF